MEETDAAFSLLRKEWNIERCEISFEISWGRSNEIAEKLENSVYVRRVRGNSKTAPQYESTMLTLIDY